MINHFQREEKGQMQQLVDMAEMLEEEEDDENGFETKKRIINQISSFLLQNFD